MCLTWNGKCTCTNKSWLCDSNLWLVLTNDLTHNSPRDFNKLFHEQLPMVFKVAGSKAPLHAKRMAVKGLKGSGKLPVSSFSEKLPLAIMLSLSNNAIEFHIIFCHILVPKWSADRQVAIWKLCRIASLKSSYNTSNLHSKFSNSNCRAWNPSMWIAPPEKQLSNASYLM